MAEILKTNIFITFMTEKDPWGPIAIVNQSFIQVVVWCVTGKGACGNVGQDPWRYMASVDRNKLTHWGRDKMDAIYFADDIFKCISFNENVWIPIKISPKFVPKGPINNIPALVQIMAWRRPGDKPLSEPMMVRLPTHICVTRPQWVNMSFQQTNNICKQQVHVIKPYVFNAMKLCQQVATSQ